MSMRVSGNDMITDACVVAHIYLIPVNYIDPAIKVAANDSQPGWNAAERISHMLEQLRRSLVRARR